MSRHRAVIRWLTITSLIACATVAPCQDGKGEAAVEVISQAGLGTKACGPCALYQALVNGDRDCRRAIAAVRGASAEDRVRALMQSCGDKPSETYRGSRRRYSKEHGLTAEDMPWFANDFLQASGLPTVQGSWLDRQDGEAQIDHLRRIHAFLGNALERGIPPLIEVRAFGANTDDPDQPVWDGLGGHWLTLLAIEPLPSDQASGFSMQLADSISGRVISAFVYVELQRPFTATRGFSVNSDGEEQWHWVKNSPYLVIVAPELALNTNKQAWYQRTVMAITYTVCRSHPPAQ